VSEQAGRTMSRTGASSSAVVAAIGATAAIVSVSIVGASGAAGALPAPSVTRLAGSAAPFTSDASVIGAVAARQELSIQVWLRPKVAAAQSFATAVSTPGSAQFHRYLSPGRYTARFGATPAAATRVEKWLRSAGFTAVGADAQRSYVRATAPAATIDRALATRLTLYRSTAAVNAGPYQLRANSTVISVPRALAGTVLGVTGLDNAAPDVPLRRPGITSSATAAAAFPCSRYYGQHVVGGLPKEFGTTSFPTVTCGYSGSQLRSAYGATSGSTGRGQTVALIELGLTKDMFLTLQDYATANHVPAPAAARYRELSLGRGSACGDPFNIEEQLDVEASYDMAPGATQLVVGGDSCNNGDYGEQGLFDADLAVLNGAQGHPLASVTSNSWGSGAETQPAALSDIEHAYLLRAAAEGVGMYLASSDGSGVAAPSDDPYAVAVGGTSLGIGAAGHRLFETGWSDGEQFIDGTQWSTPFENGASGGGPSLLWKQPGYQRGVVPAALDTVAGNRGTRVVRSVPDISADADEYTGFAVGLLSFSAQGVPTYRQGAVGGTSEAAPLVTGMVAAAQQSQSARFGFLDPVLYRLSGTSALHDTRPLTASTPARYRAMACGPADCGLESLSVTDAQNYLMSGYTGQVTLRGYDNMTGLGTPNGQQFITALRRLER
jgi:subtilase family serine protease